MEHGQDPRPQCPEDGRGGAFKRSDALATHRRKFERASCYTEVTSIHWLNVGRKMVAAPACAFDESIDEEF